MDDSPLLRGARSAGRWVLDGGLATALSTAIFAGMHVGTPGGAGIMLVVSTVVLGLALGTLRQVTGGLVVPIAFHAGYNLLGLGHARKWFVSEVFPVDFGVPRLLVVAPAGSGVFASAVAAGVETREWPATRDAALAHLRAARSLVLPAGVGVVHAWHSRGFEAALLLARRLGSTGPNFTSWYHASR